MALTGLRLEVAGLVGASAGEHGFAIGGGCAMQVHGLADRSSADVDAYVNRMDAAAFAAAQRDVMTRMRSAGFDVEMVRSLEWMRVITASRPAVGDEIVVRLNYDYRSRAPVVMERVGPVLDIDDVVSAKVRAVIVRRAERDYVDVDRILTSGRWTARALYGMARESYPALERETFARILRGARDRDPRTFARLGVAPREVEAMAARLEAAGASVGRPARPRRRRPDPNTGPVTGRTPSGPSGPAR